MSGGKSWMAVLRVVAVLGVMAVLGMMAVLTSELPAMNGAPRARARSTIQEASCLHINAHWRRCLAHGGR